MRPVDPWKIWLNRLAWRLYWYEKNLGYRRYRNQREIQRLDKLLTGKK